MRKFRYGLIGGHAALMRGPLQMRTQRAPRRHGARPQPRREHFTGLKQINRERRIRGNAVARLNQPFHQAHREHIHAAFRIPELESLFQRRPIPISTANASTPRPT